MSEVLSFSVTATPSLNKLKGRWALSNWNKNYKRQLQGYEYLKLKTPRRMRLNLLRYGSRLLDRDNLAGGCKPLIDAIRRAGLIVDDSPKWCDIIFEQEKCKRGDEITIVSISDLTAERINAKVQ